MIAVTCAKGGGRLAFAAGCLVIEKGSTYNKFPSNCARYGGCGGGKAEMAARIIDGRVLSGRIIESLKPQVEALAQKDRPVYLVAVQVGDNASSRLYVKSQQREAQRVGITYELKELPADASEKDVSEVIDELNADERVTGIILQMPLPDHLDARRLQWRIDALKDVEGVNPANMGMVVYGQPRMAPCTAMAVYELVKDACGDIRGAEVCVVGHSAIVGKPAMLLLLSDYGTTTTCHIATRNLAEHTRRADILVIAVGKAGLVTGDMIRPGATVIDVGINRVEMVDGDGRPVLNGKGRPKMQTVGDVVFEEAVEVAGAVTPVPGGVGQVTTAILLRNTVVAAGLQQSRRKIPAKHR